MPKLSAPETKAPIRPETSAIVCTVRPNEGVEDSSLPGTLGVIKTRTCESEPRESTHGALQAHRHQSAVLAVDLRKQLLPGTFEHALNELLDHDLDLSVFDARYRNDETGATAYPPAIRLKVIPFASAWFSSMAAPPTGRRPRHTSAYRHSPTQSSPGLGARRVPPLLHQAPQRRS